MAAILANTGSNNWNTNGAWVGGVQPTAADDVTIPATAVVTVPTATTVLCRSCTVSVSGTLAFASTTAVLTIGDGTAGAGNVAFSNAGTITLTGIGTINFVSTAAASTQTLTTGGATMPNLTVNTATTTTIQFADNVTATNATITLTAGILDTNGKTISAASFSSSNSNTRTLTMGAASITVSGGGNDWNTNTTTNLTVTANTTVVTVSSSGGFASIGGINYNGISFSFTSPSATAAQLIVAGATIANLTRTGGAIKGALFALGGNVTVTGTLTLTGNSVTNRLLAQSGTLGTTRTITAAAVSLTNVDFQDITAAGAAGTWTGTSMGDALGNSNITFDSPTTQTWSGTTGGNWSTNAWTSRVPLPQDTARIASAFSAAQTITMDMPRLCKDMDFTGTTGGLAVANSGNLTSYGNVTLAAGLASFGSLGGRFDGGARSSITITSAGVAWNWNAVQLCANLISGTATLLDAFTATAGLTLGIYNFNANNFNVTAASYVISGSGTITVGSGTWTITNTAGGTVWNNNGGPTLSGNAIIVVSTASANTRSFAGGGKTYGSLTYTVANSPGSLTITGANTFNTINVGPGRIVTMPASTTNTFTTWNVSGAPQALYLPGVVGNYVATGLSVLVSLSTIEFAVRVALDSYAGTLYLAGWQSTHTAIQITPTRQLTAYILNTSVAAIGNAASTSAFPDPGTAYIWLRSRVTTSSALCEYWYSNDNTDTYASVTWTSLGTPTGTNAGTTPNLTQSANLLFGCISTGIAGAPGKYRQRVEIIDGVVRSAYDATAKPFGANSSNDAQGNSWGVTGTLAQAGDGRVSLVSSSAGTKGTVSKSSGVVSVDYLTIQDSAATGGASWYAGAHSILVSNDTGWNFSAAPAGSGNLLLMGVG